MVHKKVTLLGKSRESFEDATKDAINRADKTLENIEWVEINELSIETPIEEDTNELKYQAEIELSFELEDPEDI